jgi:hypothetical protein
MNAIYRRGEEAGRTDYRAEEGELGDHGRCYRGESSTFNHSASILSERPAGASWGRSDTKRIEQRRERLLSGRVRKERKKKPWSYQILDPVENDPGSI